MGDVGLRSHGLEGSVHRLKRESASHRHVETRENSLQSARLTRR
jgi:hypothetical protein